MLEAYCALAVERGIAELAITDHVDFDPTMPAYGFASFADRERDVREAAARWADRGLAIRFGVEVTYERRVRGRDPGLAAAPPARLRDRQRPHQRRSRRTRRRTSRRSSPAARCRRSSRPYFDEVIGAARSGLFDTHRPPRLREALPGAARAARASSPPRRSCTSRCSRRWSRRGRRWRSTRPACASCRARRIPAPHIVARYRELGRRARDHRQRRPPNGVVRIWARGGVSSRDAARGSRRWRSGAGADRVAIPVPQGRCNRATGPNTGERGSL